VIAVNREINKRDFQDSAVKAFIQHEVEGVSEKPVDRKYEYHFII
jgi:hypothetical protein